MLCVVPALRALRAAARDAHITLIGLPWAKDFVQRYDKYVDDLLVFPGWPGFPEQAAQVKELPAFFQQAQRREFDLLIQMHGSGELSNPLIDILGAKHTAGFFRRDQYCPDSQNFFPWLDREHEVRRYLRLMEYLGAPSQGDALEFPLTEQDYASLRHCGKTLPLPDTYAVLHPGARLPSRRWLPLRFAQAADRLADSGMRVVLTGCAAEHEIVRIVKSAMRHPVVDLCGKTSLGGIAALIAQARLVVCNDTGISHIAAAVATPSVIIACGSDPQRWAPLDSDRHCVVQATVSCRPCMHANCPIGHPCAENVGTDEVHRAAMRMLSVRPALRRSPS